jgi:hypothetical protein
VQYQDTFNNQRLYIILISRIWNDRVTHEHGGCTRSIVKPRHPCVAQMAQSSPTATVRNICDAARPTIGFCYGEASQEQILLRTQLAIQVLASSSSQKKQRTGVIAARQTNTTWPGAKNRTIPTRGLPVRGIFHRNDKAKEDAGGFVPGGLCCYHCAQT